jgi:maltose O-acetyltransferase
MSKAAKVLSVIHRSLIFRLDGLNNRLFTDRYTKYLAKHGVHFTGRPNYIAHNAYFDGQGLDLITIGDEVVISRDVMLLTHDYSVENALHSVGHGSKDRHIKVDGPITIGDNSFIGARASLLPGTTIGDNCIIGACAEFAPLSLTYQFPDIVSGERNG